MERRFVLFLVLSFLILLGYSALMWKFWPPRQARQAAKPAAGQEMPKPGEKKPAAEKPRHEKPGEKEPAEAPKIGAPEPAVEPEKLPTRYVTLGSADPKDPYRMLVTLTSRGAAVARIELNSPRYHDLDDRSGYLGHLVVEEEAQDNGCRVEVVGAGTPAADAGLLSGDFIKTIDIPGADSCRIAGPVSLRKALESTEPGETIGLTVDRKGEELTLEATLRRYPLEVVKPGDRSHLSMLLSLQRLDQWKLEPPEETVEVGEELKGLNLWSGNWELVEADETHAVFRRVLPASGIEITKTYRLAEVPAEEAGNAAYPAYHLEFEIGIRNAGKEEHTVAYQLDGPNGLPDEGYWYASKVSRTWSGAGLRDLVVRWSDGRLVMVNCPAIADNKVDKPWEDESLTYIGIDAQYISAVLLPQMDQPGDIWFHQVHPLRLGKVDPKWKNRTNTSFRLVSTAHVLAPGEGLKQQFVLFTGPKKPDLLAQAPYELSDLVYYGWSIFALFAVPLAKILHVFYGLVSNYGLAIVMLTVLVRGCMFPMSKKQAINMLKMQQLQPELKKLQKKHEKDMMAMRKAQQELFKKHNCRPLSGCLVMLIQLPIFIGLYRALMVDVELRQAPLISEGIRWCSNLAAPDLLYDWSGFMPEFAFNWLGPYFNLLPIVTVALFLWQQKMFMPPPADEQAALQQKMMKYMMVFMGVLFFKVASGLCIYFIASSLWGVAERKFMPKSATAGAVAEPQTRAEAKAEIRAQAQAAQKAAARRDATAAQRSKKKSRWKK